MKNIKPFGPTIGRAKISNRFFKCLNNEFNEYLNYPLTNHTDQYNTSNDIISHFQNELLSVLQRNNLEELYKKCQNKTFHIHTHTYEEILLETKYPIYLCDHCKC